MLTRLEFYFKDKRLIHIKTNSFKFYNGYIIDLNLKKRFLIFKDNKLSEIPILYEEIKDVEPYVEEGK